jgi:hypothetical protein
MTSFLVVILLCSLSFVEASDSILPCLPKDLSQETLVSSEGFKSASGEKQKGVTVGETLHLLEARCQESKLVDKTGREIYFFHLIGCWGNPPADYEERLALQAQEVQRLKKQYTVLEIPCAQRDPRLIQ